MNRIDNRKNDELRKVVITKNYLKYPTGSVLIEMGNTKIICTAFIEESVPPFLKGKGTGWITAEYSMLPGSTQTRKSRDRDGKVDGRSTEIQRLIGRSLRNVIDLTKLGERTIKIDCDVIQADGGTRCASITGAFVALNDACIKLINQGILTENPVVSNVAAVSVGIKDNEIILDLCYEEDSQIDVDMNIVMNEKGEFIEIQGTGEHATFSKKQFDELLKVAEKGINELISIQKK